MATKKSAKKATNKFDFSDSVNSIKNTAKKMNDQVQDTAEEVVNDLKESGGHLKDYAFSAAKEVYTKTYNKVSETLTVENIAKTAKNVNDYSLKTADELVEGLAESSEKWQGLAEKVVKGSLKLASKQQDIVFDTLEIVKGQVSKSAVRFMKLFSKN
jgi:biotin synthase-like enzyme